MRYLFFLIAFLTLQTTTGQDKDVVFKVTNYYVKDSTMNEVVNLENLAINSDIALVFYMSDDTPSFANIWRNHNTQSYGEIKSLRVQSFNESKDGFDGSTHEFIWKYNNSYDTDTGEAIVAFHTLFIEGEVLFETQIYVIDTKELLILKGYLE